MTEILYKRDGVTFDKVHKLFKVNGNNVRFDTRYAITNENTGGSMKFEFDHSTGSEWATDTLWIYKSKEGYELAVGNEDVTAKRAQDYLDAKLGR